MTTIDHIGSDQRILIRPKKGWTALGLREVWTYRELLFFLAWRDVKVRYKQTLLGASWAVLVPLLTMLVFSVLFGLLMGQSNKPSPSGVPYAISTYAALVPWQLFANAMNQSGSSLVANRGMITKIYFPRLIAPLAPVLASLVDFAIAFVVLIFLMAGYAIFTDYQFHLSWRLLLVPVFVILTVLTALSLSLWLSAANALYRDIKYLLPFMVQMLMYVSPVVYSADSIIGETTPRWFTVLYGLNPMAGVLEGFRWALLGGGYVQPALMVTSTVGVLILLAGGAMYFRRMERQFADLA